MYLDKNQINSNIRQIKDIETFLNRPENQSIDYTKEGFVSPRHKRSLLSELVELKEELDIVKDEMKEISEIGLDQNCNLLSISQTNNFKRKIKQIEILLT